MTAKEFQYEFGIQLNQFESALRLQSDDIEYWLNKAQEELVKRRFEGLTNIRQAFEQGQSVIDDLKILIKREELSANYFTNSLDKFFMEKVIFPNDYMYLINQKSKIKFKYPKINFTVNQNKRVTTDDYEELTVPNRYSQTQTIYSLLLDPFNTTKFSSPLTTISSNNIIVYSDEKFIVTDVIIDYIKMPRKIELVNNITSELPEHLHKEIIQMAVDLFLNNTRELKQRLQRETPTADKQQNIEENE